MKINEIVGCSFILALGFMFSKGAFAINEYDRFESNCCSKELTIDITVVGRFRYLGWLYTSAKTWVNVYTDGTYYYWTFCDLEEGGGDSESCLPKRIYTDERGWYRLSYGEKSYLYYINDKDDYCIAQSVRDLHRKRY
ncbi:MAG: hypothetical protein J6P83_07095 [Bacteroidales bacterium]|nr:hypothetical protein [Bacteroidales bacterium]